MGRRRGRVRKPGASPTRSTARRLDHAHDRHRGPICVPCAVRAARNHRADRPQPGARPRRQRDDLRADRRARHPSVPVSRRRAGGVGRGDVAGYRVQTGIGRCGELSGLEEAGERLSESRRDAVVGRQRAWSRRARERAGIPRVSRFLSCARRSTGSRSRLPARGGSAGPTSTRRAWPRSLATAIRRRSGNSRSHDHARWRTLRSGRRRALRIRVSERGRNLGAARLHRRPGGEPHAPVSLGDRPAPRWIEPRGRSRRDVGHRPTPPPATSGGEQRSRRARADPASGDARRRDGAGAVALAGLSGVRVADRLRQHRKPVAGAGRGAAS
jgi:hypothetical protein